MIVLQSALQMYKLKHKDIKWLYKFMCQISARANGRICLLCSN